MHARATSTRKTTPDLAALLREAITRGQLLPNERLIEADLAAHYRVDRAHIRTALAMLDQEGLVTRERHRGARVRAISDAEALEIAETRLAVECMVARQAAQRITAAGRAALETVYKEMSAAVARADDAAYSRSNAALHREIHRIAGNETARRILATLRSHLLRLQYRVILLPGRPKTSLAEHRAIVDAIGAGKGDAAEQAMRRHLTAFLVLLRQSIAAVQHGGF